MKSILSLLFASFLSFFSTNAQELENSLLWKISGNNLEKPSYLFGTIHITCDATLNDRVKKALDETSQVVLEVDMDDPGMQAKMISGIYMKDEKKIEDLVSKEDFEAINTLLTKHAGVSLDIVQNMKPFFLTAMLYPKLLDCSMQSFEQELIKVAQAQNEEILGLETIEDQLQVFDDIPYEDQVADLLRSAKDNLEYDKATFSKMLEVYKAENIKEMQAMMDDDKSIASEHQDKLLTNRNKKWISRISELSKKQATFYGVGAGHLAGENGVILLLRKAGYTVTAVK